MTRGVETKLGCTQATPADAVAGTVEAAERTFEALDLGQKRAGGQLYLVHHDHSGGGGSQRHLAFYLWRGEAFHALLEDKSANTIAVSFTLRPNDKYVCEGRV